MTVDTYNLYMGTLDSSFSDMAILRAEDILIAHINDADYVPLEALGDQSRRCFPGEGFLDMDAYLRSLLNIGYDGVVSVETFRPEYWAKPAEWVIGEAYRTTHAAMERNGCLRCKEE